MLRARDAAHRRVPGRRSLSRPGSRLDGPLGAPSERGRVVGASAESRAERRAAWCAGGELPVRKLAEKPDHSARDESAGRLELDRDQAALAPRPKHCRVHADWHELVVALEALGGGDGGLFRGGEERIDPDSQPISPRPAGGVPEPLGREERGCGQSVCRSEREVRQARQTRLEPVHHVEASSSECKPQVGAHRDRHAHVCSSRDGYRGSDGDDLGVDIALKRSSACEEVARARRWREHRDVVSALSERSGCTRDVRVDLVGLRPRKGRDEADTEAHGRASVALIVRKSRIRERGFCSRESP